jgi:hypothetical protein
MRTLVIGLAIAAVSGTGILIWQPWRCTDGPPVAATVNGVEISMREVVALAADRASFDQYKATLIEQGVTDQLIRQEAARRHLTLSTEDEREVDRRMPPAPVLATQASRLELGVLELVAYRRALVRGQLLLRKLLDDEFPGELTPSDAALRGVFDEAPLAFAEPPAVTVRAFVVPLPETADPDQVNQATARAERIVLAAKAASSAEAFSSLIAEQGAAPTGFPDGKLGTVAFPDPFSRPAELPGLFGPALSGEVLTALFPRATEDAQRVVGPFRGPLGMFGLFVEQRRGAGPVPPFEQVRERVRERWIGRAQLALLPRLMERLRASATIDVHTGASV